jgi:NAD(P)-dependent dehydrogenase (short-subunit alcohol dehydrogenase family)
MENLRGKVAVVTGGASGIGFALARRLAAEGMALVIADVEAGALAEAAGQLGSEGADVLEVITDVKEPDQVEALADRTVSHFGAVHLVCNNAGVGAGGPVWEIPLEQWEWVMGVNFWGVLNGIRSFVPRLLAGGGGHMVNTASMAGLVPSPMMTPYSVSKFAVVALSECLQLQLQAAQAPVGVSVLCPGWVNTRLVSSDRNRPADVASLPLSDTARRVRHGMEELLASAMSPEEVADKVVRAIQIDKFYVLSHDDEAWLGLIRGRTNDIVEYGKIRPLPVPGTDVILAALAEP